ncbi:hypothetical protein GZH53_14660 [Flavihumibacter sp. R14]|nr:hypothetical protein [Flavihumibacter soli]
MTIPIFLQIAGMFVIPLLAVIVPMIIGQRYGMYHRRHRAEIQHTAIESVVATSNALLAFMLAFTFQISANRYETRKELLLEEVKNIRMVYLRAGLIPEPYRSGTRKHLVEYVDLIVGLSNDRSKLREVIRRNREILDTLWTYAEALAVKNGGSEAYALYTSALNELVYANYKRLSMVLVYRIPVAVLWGLLIIGVISMLILGYQFGVSGRGNLTINFMLATIFAVVMFLILDLDRPEVGVTQVDQKPLLTLQTELRDKLMRDRPSVP